MLIRLCFGFLLLAVMQSCVDPDDQTLFGTVDVIVVDGSVTDLAEVQTIRLNRSQADRLTGRFGSVPLTNAHVEIVVDSSLSIACHETVDGSYQLPSDFKGQIGHAYQLRFALSDGTQYMSSQQIMQSVPSINQVNARFNPNSLSQINAIGDYFRAGHDLSVDFQDPIEQHNYYRWDWNLYEKQDWCRSCQQGVYAVNNILPNVYTRGPDGSYYVSGSELYEDCFVPVPTGDVRQPLVEDRPYVYDYNCRTKCWEILHNYDINVFDDQYSNGGLIIGRPVAQIPYYTHEPCLVEVRQASLTVDAYRYFKLFADQTQKTGGLADTPPTALAGNVKKLGASTQIVVGYFTASAISSFRYWLDRKDATGLPMGATDPKGPSSALGAELFYALNLRQPIPEPTFPPPNVHIFGGPSRPPTAVCVSSDSRTPYKPEGWRD